MDYAGFWRRVGATLIDSILIGVVGGILVAILAAISDGAAIVGYIILFIGQYVYYAVMESSSYQATVGKIALGIKVTDTAGRPLGFGRALGRNVAKILSALILYIGFLMAAFTERKQALHDIVAGTLVVKKDSAPAPSDPS